MHHSLSHERYAHSFEIERCTSLLDADYTYFMAEKLTLDQVSHIAKLARMEVSAEEAEKLREQISGVLAFVEKLQEVSVDGVQPTSHVGDMMNVLREDSREEVNIGQENAERERMVGQFPREKSGFLQVPPVFMHKK